MTDLHILHLRQAYNAGVMDYKEFRRRFNEAMKEAANDR